MLPLSRKISKMHRHLCFGYREKQCKSNASNTPDMPEQHINHVFLCTRKKKKNAAGRILYSFHLIPPLGIEDAAAVMDDGSRNGPKDMKV